MTADVAPEPALAAESFAYAMLQASAEHAAWRASNPSGQGSPHGQVKLARLDQRLVVTLDRQHARNAIDRGMRDALFDAFTLAEADPEIAKICLRTCGKCFSVGAELDEFGTTRDPVAAHAIRMRTLPALPLIRRPGLLDVHVQGACVGSGLELAAFAQRLTAAPDAWFQLPELRMGILPGFGGTVSLPRRIGRQRAALLMLSGKRIAARTALDWGLVDQIVHQPPAD